MDLRNEQVKELKSLRNDIGTSIMKDLKQSNIMKEFQVFFDSILCESNRLQIFYRTTILSSNSKTEERHLSTVLSNIY